LMSLFVYFQTRRSHRRPATATTPHAHPRLEVLEDRSLPSGNVISGYVFNDVNNNGIFDAGEAAIAGSAIQLRNASNTIVGTATTDAKGFYQFNFDNTIDTTPTTLTRIVSIPAASTDWTKPVVVPQ